jgi:tetratricopeptide (TPR) repeat protein
MNRLRVGLTIFVCAAAGCPILSRETNDLSSHNEAAQFNLSDPTAFVHRGIAYTKTGEWDHAIRDFTEAIKLNPNEVLAYDYRGCAYFVKGELDKAINDFGQVIKLDTTNSRVYLNRAGAYHERGNFDAAMSDVNECLRLNPTNSNALTARGTFHCEKDQFEKAIQDYNEALRIDPKNDSTYTALAWLLATCEVTSVRSGKRAVEAATKACDLASWKRWECINTLAAAFAEVGDFDKAVKYVKQAMTVTGVSDDDRKKMQKILSLYEHRKPNRNWKW